MRRPAARRAAALLCAAALGATLLGACSGSPAPVTGPTGSFPAGSSGAGLATARVGPLRITDGYLPQPASPDVAAAYLTVSNTGRTEDRLLRVSSAAAGRVTPMTETDHGGTGSMAELATVRIPAHGSFRFTPGHAHLMFEQRHGALREGDTVLLTLIFAHAGAVRLRVPVVAVTGPAPAGSTGSG